MRILLVGLIWILFSFILKAQSRDEIQSLRQNIPKKNTYQLQEFSMTGVADADIIAGFLFRFYKSFISSQDYGSCSFTPSCSEYAISAIKKEGLIIGTINTLDRLTRCHKNNIPDYTLDPDKNLLIDEVRNLKYEKD